MDMVTDLRDLFQSAFGGDLLDLWAAVNGQTIKDAYWDALKFLGVDRPRFQNDSRREEKRRKSRRVGKPTGLQPAKRGSRVEDYLRTERAIPTETIKLYRIGELDPLRWKKDGQPRDYRGPWIAFPFLDPDGRCFNIKYLHVERREETNRHGRKILRKFILQEPGTRDGLFGWQAVPDDATECTICEGEVDAMSATAFGLPVGLSMPMGAGTGNKLRWIDEDWDELERFTTIFLCYDADKAGRESIGEAAQRLGTHRVRIVALPGCPGYQFAPGGRSQRL